MENLLVQNVTFSVPAGQVCAFLGPNGAGKSTTMKMLTGFLSPTSGSAKIGGFETQSNRLEAAELLGYLPENGPLYPEMTPQSFLRYVGKARMMSSGDLSERMEYVAEQCDLGMSGENRSESCLADIASGRQGTKLRCMIRGAHSR